MEKISIRKKKAIIYVCIMILFSLMFVFFLWSNKSVQTTFYEIADNKIPESFNGYRIAQISDLHNAQFGTNNARLLEILEKNNPDIICITGDLIDSNHTNVDVAVSFVKQAVKIAPCYYVTGNHEAWIGNSYNELEKQLLSYGVIILHNQSIKLTKNDETLILSGINDPDSHNSGIIRADIDEAWKGIHGESGREEEYYSILLSHRPEVFHEYVKKGMNLVLSGHAHGGQFRLPIIGGVVAPNQGLFPKYDCGIYQDGETSMVVSRGLGNSIIPIRINNRPEVVFVVLSN